MLKLLWRIFHEHLISGFLHNKEELLKTNDLEGLADKVVLLEKTLSHKREDFRSLESEHKGLHRKFRELKQKHDSLESEKKSLKEDVAVLEQHLSRQKERLSSTHLSESPSKRSRLSFSFSSESNPTQERTCAVNISSSAANFRTNVKINEKPQHPLNDPVVAGLNIMKRKVGSGLLKENNAKSAIRIGYDGFGGHSKHLTTRNFVKPTKQRSIRQLDSAPPLPTLNWSLSNALF